MKKILGISASPRHEATEAMVQLALRSAEQCEGIETQYLSLANYNILPCNHCDYCSRKKAACVRKDDYQELIEIVLQADGYVIGSPVYSFNPTPNLIMLFNRMRPLRFTHPNAFAGKVGGALTVGGTRNGGQEMALNSIINMFLARGILVVGGSSGHYAGGKVWTDNKNKDGALEDSIGVCTVEDIGLRVANALLMLK